MRLSLEHNSAWWESEGGDSTQPTKAEKPPMMFCPSKTIAPTAAPVASPARRADRFEVRKKEAGRLSYACRVCVWLTQINDFRYRIGAATR